MNARLALMAVSVAVLGGTALAQPAPFGPTKTLPGWGGTAVPQPGQAALPDGLVTVAPGSVVVTYYEVRPVDTVHAMVKVAEVRPDKVVVHLETVCKVGDMLVITG